MRKILTAAGVVAVLATGWLMVPVIGAGAQPGTVYGCVSSTHTLTHVSVTGPMSCPSQRPVNWPAQVGPAPSPSPSPTATPTSSPSPSPSPTSTNPPGTCTATTSGGGTCNAFVWSGWPGSNGFNTYVNDQDVGLQPGGSGVATVTDPSHWSAVGHYNSCGGCVQTYTAVQQLTNNWGTTDWSGSSDTPLSKLSALTITYDETSPAGSGEQYEFSPDVWTNYAGKAGPGSGDIMMWADTSSVRCDNNGLSASDILGQATLDGQNWTVYRYGGAGGEIVFILDGSASTDPVDSGTCARQASGTLDVYGALQWLAQNNVALFPSMASLTMSQLNVGWEITDTNGGTYQMNNLAYNVTVAP